MHWFWIQKCQVKAVPSFGEGNMHFALRLSIWDYSLCINCLFLYNKSTWRGSRAQQPTLPMLLQEFAGPCAVYDFIRWFSGSCLERGFPCLYVISYWIWASFVNLARRQMSQPSTNQGTMVTISSMTCHLAYTKFQVTKHSWREEYNTCSGTYITVTLKRM